MLSAKAMELIKLCIGENERVGHFLLQSTFVAKPNMNHFIKE
ncbi:hypothetical protein B4168_3300 [Anoxybacillus flavithermus]|nr:hypothetical protein B4168_3300 [Anoxybacillus flavithermus]OAO85129.1 hypothetical protein GT23_3183 [Parageobacillus thermoglucosidasius]